MSCKPTYKGIRYNSLDEIREVIRTEFYQRAKIPVRMEETLVDTDEVSPKLQTRDEPTIQPQILTEEQRLEEISEVTRDHRSVIALKSLALKLASRIGAGIKFINDKNVKLKGYNYGNTSVINLAYATPDTPFHEILAHPIIRAIKSEKPELYDSLLRELETGKGKEILDWVKKNYVYKHFTKPIRVSENVIIKPVFEDTGEVSYVIIDTKEDTSKTVTLEQISKMYPDLLEIRSTLADHQEEALVTLLGMMADNKLSQIEDHNLTTTLQKVIEWLKDFVRSLLLMDAIKVKDLPINTTLEDLAEIMAYGDNKIILPGYKVEYYTPLGNKYDTLEEVFYEIKSLAQSEDEVDLNKITLSQIKEMRASNYIKWKLENQGKLYEDLIKEKKWYVYDGTIDGAIGYLVSYNNKYGFFAWDGQDYIFVEFETHAVEKVPFEKFLEIYESINGMNSPYKDLRVSIEPHEIEDIYPLLKFVKDNYKFENALKAINLWREANNIVYDPEEAYSRGHGFYSVVGAYSDIEVELLLKNILKHIEDNKMVGSDYVVSAFTRPPDNKKNIPFEKGGGRVRFVIYPKPEHIKWAATSDVFSGSLSDVHEKMGYSGRKETISISYTKAPDPNSLMKVRPSIAEVIDDIRGSYNELGIELTFDNFRLEYDEDVDYSTKKLIDAINNMLDEKYGKILKPNIKPTGGYRGVYSLLFISHDGDVSIVNRFENKEEAIKEFEKRKNKVYPNVGKVDLIYEEIPVGKKPQKTKDNTENVSDFFVEIEKKESELSFRLNDKLVEIKHHPDTDKEMFFLNGKEITEAEYYELKLIKEMKESSIQPKLLTNLKILALKRIAREYPMSFVTTKVVPIDDSLIGAGTLMYSKVDEKQPDPMVIEKVKIALKKMGVSVENLLDYAKKSGIDVSGVDGVADLARGVIAVALGKEGEVLTEEMVHIATAILEQANPALVTEMIAKIDRFKIYKDVFEKYKNNKYYQLPNGKPDIRKIKKEAVDRLIVEILLNKGANYPELLTEENLSIVERLWNAILDWFRGMYRKNDLSIFEETAEQILEGDIGTIENIRSDEIFFSVKPNKAVDDIYNRILSIDAEMELIPQTIDEKRHYLFRGKKVAKTVTEKVKEKLNIPDRTPEQILRDESKRDWGIEGHNFIANYIKTNLIDKNGYALDNPTNIDIEHNLPDSVANALKDFARRLISSYAPGTRFLIEVKAINEKYKGGLASTIDFIAIEPDGDNNFKMDVLDWKFMSINKEIESDVPWYKQKEWNAQMGYYADMMINYGVQPRQLRKRRMIPFQINYVYDIATLGFKPISIEIGDLDPSKENRMYLIPVAIESESTGNTALDKLVASLRSLYSKIYSVVASPEEYHIKIEKLRDLAKTIRAIHIQKDFEPLVRVAKQFLNDAKVALDKFENTDIESLSIDDLNIMLQELLSMKETAHKFTMLDDIFLSVYKKDSLDEKNKKTLKQLDEVAISTMRMLKKLDAVFTAYTVHVAKKQGVELTLTEEGKIAPEKEIDRFSRSFLEPSKMPAKLISLASNLIQRSKSEAALALHRMINEISPLLRDLEAEAARQGKKAFDLIGTFQNGMPQLISKIDKDFVNKVKRMRKERNRKFFLDVMDLEKYRELSKKVLDKRIENIKKRVYSLDEKENEIAQEKAIAAAERALNIEDKRFEGFDDYDFKRLFWESLKDESKYYSTEYNNMSETAKKVWQLFMDLNARARKLGYLSKKHSFYFFPLMEAMIVEKLSNFENVGKAVGSIVRDLYTIRAEEYYEYSRTDELSGQLKREIPKLFTRFSKDVKEISTDLSKVAALWIGALTEYEASRNIENTLLVLYNVEKNKGSIVTDENGQIIFDGGVPKTKDDNEINSKLLMSIIDDGIYGLKENLDSMGNAVLTSLGRRFTRTTGEQLESRVLSAKKVISNMNRLVQILAVGLKTLVAIPNHFGAHAQTFINSGRIYKASEFEKNYTRLLAHSVSLEEKAFLHEVIPYNEDAAIEAHRRLTKEQGFLNFLKSWSFLDIMMVTNWLPDRAIQMANALSFFESYMVDENGKIVNIRSYLRRQDAKKYKEMNYAQRRELEDTFESRYEELKKKKSLRNVAKIEGNRLVIPNVSDSELARFRTMIIDYGTKLTSQVNRNNRPDYQRDMIVKSFMMFKTWIPKQLSVRFLDVHKNLETEQWEYGRTRAFLSAISHLGISRVMKVRDILLGTDEGLRIMHDLYQKKKSAYYQATGQNLTITEEEFYDLIREEIRNQLKELAVLVSLVGLVIAMRVAEPPEDEDDETLNRWKYFMRLSNKIADEIWFYYNPISFQSMTRGSVFPAMDIAVKTYKFFNHLGLESYGMVIDDEDIIEKAHPTKYLFDLIPVVSQVQNDVMPYIDPEWAKEQGVRVTEEARPFR